MRIVARSWLDLRWPLLLVAGAAIVAFADAVTRPEPPPAVAPRAIRISGTVHAATDVLPAWVFVWNPQRQRIAEADADGRWSMALPAGEYRIAASRLPEEPPVAAAVDIGVHADLHGIALLLDPIERDLVTWPPRGATWIEGAVAGVRDGAFTVELEGPDGDLMRRIVRVDDGAYRVAVTEMPRRLTAYRWPVMDGAFLPSGGAGPVRVDVDLTERAVGTLFGRVTDRRGRPIAGLKVEGHQVHTIAEPDVIAITGEDGFYAMPVRAGSTVVVHREGMHSFSVPDRGPGPWRLDISLVKPSGISSCDVRDRPVQHDAPHATEVARLRALLATRGDPPTPTPPLAGFRIAGSVHADADVSPSRVIAWSAGRRVVAVVADDGRWAMTLPAGDYRLGASRRGGQPPEELIADLTVDGDLDGVALLLDGGAAPSSWQEPATARGASTASTSRAGCSSTCRTSTSWSGCRRSRSVAVTPRCARGSQNANGRPTWTTL